MFCLNLMYLSGVRHNYETRTYQGIQMVNMDFVGKMYQRHDVQLVLMDVYIITTPPWWVGNRHVWGYPRTAGIVSVVHLDLDDRTRCWRPYLTGGIKHCQQSSRHRITACHCIVKHCHRKVYPMSLLQKIRTPPLLYSPGGALKQRHHRVM